MDQETFSFRMNRAFNTLLELQPKAFIRHWTPVPDEEEYKTEDGVPAGGSMMFVGGRFGVYVFSDVSRVKRRSLRGTYYTDLHHDTFRVIEYDEDGDLVSQQDFGSEEAAVCFIESSLMSEELSNRITDNIMAEDFQNSYSLDTL